MKWDRFRQEMLLCGGRMVEESAILGNYPVEEVGTIKYLEELRQFPSGYKIDAAAGTAKRFKSLDRRFGDAAILCERAIIVGSQVAKVHILSDAIFDTGMRFCPF
jgi:hypothetical protein